MALTNFHAIERIARLYDFLDLPFERKRYRPLRPLMFHGTVRPYPGCRCRHRPQFSVLSGGRDRGRPRYQPGDAGRGRARLNEGDGPGRAARDGRDRLDFPDPSFDAAIATFLFCVLPMRFAGPGLARARARRQAGRGDQDARICPAARSAAAPDRGCGSRGSAWAYGAGFDRNTEAHVPDAGLELTGTRFVVDDLIRLIGRGADPPLAG